MKAALLLVGGFLGGYLFSNFVKEVTIGSPGGAVIFLIMFVGFLYYLKRKYMPSKRQHKVGEDSH